MTSPPSLVASPLLSPVSSFVITYCLVLTAHTQQYFHEKSRKGDIVSNLYTWKCFILLPYLIDNLAAFIIAVCKPSTLRILKELLYHLLDMRVVAEKSNVFILFDAFFLRWFISFVSKFFGFSFCLTYPGLGAVEACNQDTLICTEKKMLLLSLAKGPG